MSFLKMGDETVSGCFHQVECAFWQLNSGVSRAIFEQPYRRNCVLGSQHRIDKQPHVSKVDKECCIADLMDLHRELSSFRSPPVGAFVVMSEYRQSEESHLVCAQDLGAQFEPEHRPPCMPQGLVARQHFRLRPSCRTQLRRCRSHLHLRRSWPPCGLLGGGLPVFFRSLQASRFAEL